jgi:hypothetical protein
MGAPAMALDSRKGTEGHTREEEEKDKKVLSCFFMRVDFCSSGYM